MLTLTEIFLKARFGVYADTPENRRLHRVGQHYGMSEQRMQQEQDERLARRKAQERVSDQQYIKAQELLSALRGRGLDEFYISRSITDFGVSTYVQGYGLKFRISDHSVTNVHRIMNEDFFTYDSDVEKLADYAKEHYDVIQERVRKREEEMNRCRQKEKELDNYWESISGDFDGKVFGENRRTYAKPDEFAAKHPEWMDIYAVDLGGGAYAYEWAQKKNGYGRTKPSYAWLEWHRREHEVRKSVFLNLTERFLIKSKKGGLVPKKITVNRNGKSFIQTVYVKEKFEDSTRNNQRKTLDIKTNGYEQTENDFRRIQAASRGLSDEQVRNFHDGSKQLDEGVRDRISGVLGRWITCCGYGDSYAARVLENKVRGKRFEILPDVDGKLFHDVFEVVRTYLRSGDAVDLHDDYSECRCYLSRDGLSGFAIEPDGNLVSVFSLKKGFLPTCGRYIVEQGATKLDCFQSKMQDLPSYYKAYLGFELASKLEFDRHFLEEDKGKGYADWFVKTYGEADVLFMVKGVDISMKEFTDYDAAVEYRNSFLKK